MRKARGEPRPFDRHNGPLIGTTRLVSGNLSLMEQRCLAFLKAFLGRRRVHDCHQPMTATNPCWTSAPFAVSARCHA